MLRTAGILSHRPVKIKCYDWLNSPGIGFIEGDKGKVRLTCKDLSV